MSSDLITEHFHTRKNNRRDVKNQAAVGQSISPDTKFTVKKEADMQTLKNFDLQWEFGPCIGVTRLERWERAHKHGLNPSQAVKDLVLQHIEDKDYAESLWHEYDI